MTKAGTTALIMVLALLTLTACSNGTAPDGEHTSDTASSQTVYYAVSATSNNIKYEPYEHLRWIHIPTEHGLAAGDGIPLSLEEVSKSLPEIQYTDDFQVIIEGDGAKVLRYVIYNDKLGEIYNNEDGYSLPSETGIYLLRIDITWSNGETGSSGLTEYYLKIKI